MFSNNDDILKIRFYYEPKPYWQYWYCESPYLILDIFGNFILKENIRDNINKILEVPHESNIRRMCFINKE